LTFKLFAENRALPHISDEHLKDFNLADDRPTIKRESQFIVFALDLIECENTIIDLWEKLAIVSH
jgi:hypothetical protein